MAPILYYAIRKMGLNAFFVITLILVYLPSFDFCFQSYLNIVQFVWYFCVLVQTVIDI